jgi:hypothetical protein
VPRPPDLPPIVPDPRWPVDDPDQGDDPEPEPDDPPPPGTPA